MNKVKRPTAMPSKKIADLIRLARGLSPKEQKQIFRRAGVPYLKESFA